MMMVTMMVVGMMMVMSSDDGDDDDDGDVDGDGDGANDTAGALDKEALDKEARAWKPEELQSWVGRGYRHRPHQIRNPPASGPS